jgi:uncharacterized protein
MRDLLALAVLAGTLAVAATEPPVPAPQGFVTDTAGVVPAPLRARITRLLEELQAKTGAEIAVVTVPSTQPLDDFTYAMRIADAWKPGRKGEDTGVVFLVAVEDRRLRVLVGYGLEGVLPDGLVGEIQDREVVPAFRAGQLGEGIWRGVAALAAHVAAARGVELDGVPPPPAARAGPPLWLVIVLVLAALVFLSLLVYAAGSASPRGVRRRRTGWHGPVWPGGFGSGGGFGGGGGDFGGFGGGGFGGGGAGRSW